MRTSLFIVLLSFCVSQDYTYNLEDVNSNSFYFGETLSPEIFSNEITIHYFGKQT